MIKIKPKGRESLKKAVQYDIDSKRTFQTKEELWEKYDWIIKRAEHYANKTGLQADEILNAWEEDRDYWYMNYYQEANQPVIEGDNVRVFESVEEMMENIGEKKFRCPSCNSVSTNPYECNSGDKMSKGKVCNWKVYGLFGDLGKGVYVYIKDQLKGENIFMPVSWE